MIKIYLTGNKTLVKLVVQGDKVTAKPIMKRPKIKQGLIPGEGKCVHGNYKRTLTNV